MKNRIDNTPETDKEWENPTMNILDFAKKMEVERDEARRKAEALRNGYRLTVNSHIERGRPLPWEAN